MNSKHSTAYRFKSIQSLFIIGMILLTSVVSLPLLFFGTTIITNITRSFGEEILREELYSLIGPIDSRYKTLKRIGLEDSATHLEEIRKDGIETLRHYRYKQSGNVFVVSSDGKAILSTDFDTQNMYFIKQDHPPGKLEYPIFTQEQIGVALFYPAWDSYIGLTMEKNELFASRNLFIKIGISVLLAVLLLAGLCVAAIYHFIVSPVLRITQYAEQISLGNLQAEIPGRFILELARVKKDIQGMVTSLINREKKYRAIFNAPSDAIVLHESDTGRVLEANDAIYAMYGYTPEEFLTMTIGDISSNQHPYTMEEVGKRMQKLSTEKHLRFEWHGKKKNGDLFWVDVSLRPVLFAGKECVLAVVRDIDEQKKATKLLAAEKEQLAITLRSIGDGVITTDSSGNVILLNRVAEEITGWTQHEATGHPLDDILRLINGKDGSTFPNPASEVLNTGLKIELSANTILIARDGSKKNISDSAAPIFDPASNIVGVVLVFRDITEKQRLEQELLKIKKLESVGILAGGIAHDFNNLLSAILGNINLSRTLLEKDSRSDLLLAEAEKASLRARHLTQQLLTFSKGGEPVRETTDLVEIITDNAGFVLRGTQIQFNLNVADDLWQVDIDAGQIGQVIQNILINARQAMSKKGNYIEITAQNCVDCAEDQILESSCVHVTITDNGPGIPPDVLEKIFDPYFTTKKEGSGLGLAISHSIIQKHNGILLAESSSEGGSTFTIKLPVATKVITHQNIIPEIRPKQKNLHILVMDDEQMLLDICNEMITFLGHRCETVSNGTEALTRFQEVKQEGEPFDVVIMDLTIPGGMGGKEAGAKLLKLDSQAKIIVASGYSNDPVMANYQDYGFAGVLTKPFTMQDLENVL